MRFLQFNKLILSKNFIPHKLLIIPDDDTQDQIVS